MKIEMNESFATPRESFAKGRRYDVPDAFGQKLVKKGTAIEIKPRKREDGDREESEEGGDAAGSTDKADRSRSTKV